MPSDDVYPAEAHLEGQQGVTQRLIRIRALSGSSPDPLTAVATDIRRKVVDRTTPSGGWPEVVASFDWDLITVEGVDWWEGGLTLEEANKLRAAGCREDLAYHFDVFVTPETGDPYVPIVGTITMRGLVTGA